MPSEFSISEAPLGDVLSGAAVFGPSHQFDQTEVKYRYTERYTSEASNRKFLGIPLGVYLGFTPTFKDRILTLSADSEYGYCFARIASQDDPLYIVDVIIQADGVLDFSNHNSFPVNVILRVNGRLGTPHFARILTQTSAPVYPTDVLLGVVTGPDSIDISEPFNRNTPFAYSGAPLGYGFMQGGSVENLLNAVALNAEVAAARTDLSGTTHPDLVSRLDADATGAAMAGRLGKELRTIFADDFTLSGAATSVNISRAFSRYHRNIASNTPEINFDGFASETRVGAITAGVVPDPPPEGTLTDSERNVCAIIDATTESRLIDVDRQVAYGRLTHSEISLSGTEITFNMSSTTVDGVGTQFDTTIPGSVPSRKQVEPGDIIQDPISGDFFEVASITSDVQLELAVPFPNATTPAATPPTARRTFTLSAHVRTGPTTEADFTMPASTIRVYFNAWLSVETSQYDYITELLKNFEPPAIESATTSLAGKALTVTGIPEGKAGSIYEIRQNPGGDLVGAPHIHTIEFDGASSGGPGIVNVTQRGPIGEEGDEGSGGSPGPPGPQGAQGQGFDNFNSDNLFRESAPFNHSALGSGVQYSYNTSMVGTEILFLSGAMSEWFSPYVFDSDDHFQIDDIRVVSGTDVILDARVPVGGNPSAVVRFFLNAATT